MEQTACFRTLWIKKRAPSDTVLVLVILENHQNDRNIIFFQSYEATANVHTAASLPFVSVTAPDAVQVRYIPGCETLSNDTFVPSAGNLCAEIAVNHSAVSVDEIRIPEHILRPDRKAALAVLKVFACPRKCLAEILREIVCSAIMEASFCAPAPLRCVLSSVVCAASV